MLVMSVTKGGLMAVVIYLTACAQQQLDQFNKDLANFNQALAGGTAPVNRSTGAVVGLAQNTEAGKGVQTQLVVPADRTTAAALEAALPTIKKVSALHQCMQNGSSARLAVIQG